MTRRQDYSDLLYGPVYAAFATEATLTCDALTSPASVDVIDRSAGEEITGQSDASRQVFKPAALIKAADLAEIGITPADLTDARLEMNDETWVVRNYVLRANLHGERGGEVLLVLEKYND